LSSPDITYRLLDASNVVDLICAEGGAEFARAGLTRAELGNEIDRIVEGRLDLIASGLTGRVAYSNGSPIGFVELMPLETAPVPIVGEGLWIVLCLHVLVEENPSIEESIEAALIEQAITLASGEADGLTVLAWDHDTHWPRSTFESHGFEVVEASPVAGMTRYLMSYRLASSCAQPYFSIAPSSATASANEQHDAEFLLEYCSLCPFSLRAKNQALAALRVRAPNADVRVMDRGHELILVDGEIARLWHADRWWSYPNFSEVLSQL